MANKTSYTQARLKKIYGSIENPVKTCFSDLPSLLDTNYSLRVAVAYMFFTVEEKQRLTLYLGARRLHLTDSKTTWDAINQHHLNRKDFCKLFETIYEFPVCKKANNFLAAAQQIRNDTMHGKTPTDAQHRMAIANTLQYAAALNRHIVTNTSKEKLTPFIGDASGLAGTKPSYDVSTSRWVLKGMGFFKSH